jgi:hypothetical protein
MKTEIILAMATGAYPFVQSMDLKQMNLQNFPFDPSNINKALRARRISENVCGQDMQLIADDEDLNNHMEEINEDFGLAFEANFTDYCVGSKKGSKNSLDCTVDYNSFSEDYKSNCVSLGGSVYNVALFMTCHGDLPGAELDLEMELKNIPSCVGETCDLGEIYSIVLDSIKATEASISGTDSNISCDFFHDYIDLTAAPNTITFQNGYEEGTEETISRASYRSLAVPTAISLALAIFFIS